MAAKFLTIYTPTYRRPSFLELCRQSVEDQTLRGEIQHIVVEDLVGVGIAGMFAEIPNHLDEFTGEFVYVLQDDDVLAARDVVQVLWQFARQRRNPPVVMVKCKKRPYIFPTFWEERPRCAHVDLANYVVRRDVFAKHVRDFGPRYEGDFDFIDSLWTAGWEFAWCDLIFARAMVTGRGRPQSDLEMGVRAAREMATAKGQRR